MFETVKQIPIFSHISNPKHSHSNPNFHTAMLHGCSMDAPCFRHVIFIAKQNIFSLKIACEIIEEETQFEPSTNKTITQKNILFLCDNTVIVL